MKNDMKQVIQENIIKAMINILKSNDSCKNCPLANTIVNKLPNQLMQDLYKR